VSSLFAAILGVNPIQHLLAASRTLSSLPTAAQHKLTGRQFFPHLISGPFHHGLVLVFGVSAALAALAGLASLLRGSRYIDAATADEAFLSSPPAPPEKRGHSTVASYRPRVPEVPRTVPSSDDSAR
jgi:hypothetical protein